MIRKLSRALADIHLRSKLFLVIVGTMLIILTVNIFVYYNLNMIIKQLDDIYIGNVRLNELEDALDMVQNNMAEYLNTKSTDSLNEYYQSAQEYQNLLEGLEKKVTDNKLKLMEHDIYHMSQNYLKLAESTILDKRGRKIEQYKEHYEEASKLYEYINSHITSLNGYRFRANTESYKELSSALSYMEFTSMLIFVVMAVFDVMLVLLVTRNITQPLNELAVAADKVSAGELDDVGIVKVHSKDEIGVVTIAFNQMVSSIPGYLSRLRESMEKEQLLKEKELMMESHLKDAQLKYLQAQINPHFLFNTLNAGTQLAMMEGADRTYEYIQKVAAFFRYNITENDEVTLAQEIHIAACSLNLLNVRIPGMILQPIVENSVNYGIRDIEREGKIELSVYKVDDNICISIMDNGVGITQEKIHSILSGEYKPKKPEEEAKKGNGIGLNNVIERLRLYYNNKNNFEIISNGRNQGTEVVITVPYTEE